MTEFQKKVVGIVKSIPSGKVVSYGQVALALGIPRAARQVGWTLRNLSPDALPWWRVINNAGRISIKNNIYVDAEVQKKLLEAEGVKVADNFDIDIAKYRFPLN